MNLQRTLIVSKTHFKYMCFLSGDRSFLPFLKPKPNCSNGYMLWLHGILQNMLNPCLTGGGDHGVEAPALRDLQHLVGLVIAGKVDSFKQGFKSLLSLQ